MFVLNGQFRTPIYKGQVGNFTGQSSPQNCRVPFKVGGGGQGGVQGGGREGAGRGQRYVGCMGVQGRVQGGGSGCREVRGCRDVRGVQ